MKYLEKIKNKVLKLSVLIAISAPTVALAAAGDDKGVVGIMSRLTKAASSAGPLLSISAFIIGMVALFKAVTTFMNHSENPRENPLKNVAFFGVAAAVGLGFTFSSNVVLETFFGKSESASVDEKKMFEVN